VYEANRTTGGIVFLGDTPDDADNEFDNDGQTFLKVYLSSSSAIITLKSQLQIDGHAITDLAVTISGSNAEMMIGPFPKTTYNDAYGRAHFSCAVGAGMKMTAVKMHNEVTP
jgi:hypothetical protein